MKVKTEEFEKKFDAGEDVTEHLDLSGARRRGTNSDGSMWIFRRG